MDTITRPRATEPLREEHRDLLPHIHELGLLADQVGVADDDATWAGVEQALEFLTGHLAPHAQAEDAVLYPAVEAAMGAPGATRTMSRDHVEVMGLVEQLAREAEHRGPIDRATAARLRSVLYGLHAVVSLHFAKEEEIYLPTLDAALGPDEADDLFRRLEAAAASARA